MFQKAKKFLTDQDPEVLESLSDFELLLGRNIERFKKVLEGVYNDEESPICAFFKEKHAHLIFSPDDLRENFKNYEFFECEETVKRHQMLMP